MRQSRGGRARVGLALVGLLLTACVLAAWWLTRERTSFDSVSIDRAESSHASVVRVSSDTPRVEVLVENSAATTIVAGSASSVAQLVVNVIRDADATPIVGVNVTASRFAERFTATTDENGAARFKLPSAFLVRFLEVPASADTARIAKWVELSCAGGSETVITVRAKRGASLLGVVVDDTGRAIAGAVVQWWSTPGSPYRYEPDGSIDADERGAFVIENLGEEFHVAASAPSLCCQLGLAGRLSPGAAVEGLQVVVAPCAIIAGHVVDARGAPIADASLAISAANSSSEGRATSVREIRNVRWGDLKVSSGADGSFRFEGLARDGRTRSTWVQHPIYIGDYAQLNPEVADNVVTLQRGAEVSGIVWQADGAPAVGAKVRIGHIGGRMCSVETATDGTFECGGLVESSTEVLRVHHAGHAVLVRQNIEISARSPRIEVRLERGLALAGTVVDTNDQPRVGIRVTLRGDRLMHYEGTGFAEPTTWEWAHNRHETYSDAAGKFEFTDLYDGEFIVKASVPGDPTIFGDVVTRAGDLDIRLRIGETQSPTVVFEGRVIDALTGVPITKFRVTPMAANERDDSMSGRIVDFESSTGTFRVGGIEAGKMQLVVSADGYASWKGGKSVHQEGTYRVEVELAPKRELSLRLVDPAGKPLDRHANAFLETIDGERMMIPTGETSSASMITLSGQPTTIVGLPASRLLFRIVMESIEQPAEVEFDLRSPYVGVQDVRLDLREPRSVDLVVFVARAGAELGDLGEVEELSRIERGGFVTGVEPPADKVIARAYGRNRNVLSSLELTRTDAGFVTKSMNEDGRDAMTDDVPLLLGTISGWATELEISCRGCRTVRIDLTKIDEHNFMRYVILRRE